MMTDKIHHIDDKFYMEATTALLNTRREHMKFGIYKDKDGKLHPHNVTNGGMQQDLYFMSDGKIEEGNYWMLYENGKAITIRKRYYAGNLVNHPDNEHATIQHPDYSKGDKKIVAAVNPKLNFRDVSKIPKIIRESRYGLDGKSIVFDVPRPSEKFLRSFIESDGIGYEKVLIEVEEKISVADPNHFAYEYPVKSYVLKIDVENIINVKKLEPCLEISLKS